MLRLRMYWSANLPCISSCFSISKLLPSLQSPTYPWKQHAPSTSHPRPPFGCYDTIKHNGARVRSKNTKTQTVKWRITLSYFKLDPNVLFYKSPSKFSLSEGHTKPKKPTAASIAGIMPPSSRFSVCRLLWSNLKQLHFGIFAVWLQ